MVLMVLVLITIFQSTLPYGSDGCKVSLRRNAIDFNPRSLTGATININAINSFNRISIHAPLRERRTIYGERYEKKGISIHAPLRERQITGRHINRSIYFNPRSLTGATASHVAITSPHTISIHAPLRERLHPYQT